MNKNLEQNVNTNRNGRDKINSKSENLTKMKVSVDFSGSLTSLTRYLGCACAHIQKSTWGVFIGACALNRANMVC